MKAQNILIAGLVTFALTACGGGTGSTGSSSQIKSGMNGAVAGDGGGGVNKYTNAAGNTNPALLTTINAYDFVHLLLGVNREAFRAANEVFPRQETLIAEPTATNLMTGMMTILEEELKTQQRAAKDAAAREISNTHDCEGGGTYTVSGTLDNSTWQGTLEVNYNDCIVDSVLKRGKGTLTVNKTSSGDATDVVFGYDGVTEMTATEYFIYTGSQHVIRSLTNGKVVRAEVYNDMNRFNQANDHYSLDSTINTFGMSTSAGSGSGTQVRGQLCDGAYGCIEITTRIPFKSGQGELTMAGVDNSKIKLYVDNGYLVYQLDEGNGSYQEPVYYQ